MYVRGEMVCPPYVEVSPFKVNSLHPEFIELLLISKVKETV